MYVDDFVFELPPELIAKYPLAERSASRLLHLDRSTGAITHQQFFELPKLLRPHDLLVFNDTKVIPARMFATKATGGQVEILVERILDKNTFLAQIKASKSPRLGSTIQLQAVTFTVLERVSEFFRLHSSQDLDTVLPKFGHVPLPPYINRNDEVQDYTRYQTVYATKAGAVAAPTAGLHFDEPLLTAITALGVKLAFITLHVGSGTFQPVRVHDITKHTMHSEYLEVTPTVCDLVTATKQQGGRVIAVGTTTVRSLETAASNGSIAPFYGDSNIFIYPGFKFRCVDAIITNFHLPKSTLLMLVSAFAGLKQIQRAYQIAIQNRYRFYSYGDAMLLE